MLQNRRSTQSRRPRRSQKRRRHLHRVLKADSDRSLRLESLEKRELLAGDLELIAISPNFGSFITDGTVLSERPRELTLQFTPGQDIDPASLDAIQIIGAGFDGSFADGNEISAAPGFIGLGGSPNQVIYRFAQNLTDDLYRISISGSSASPLQNTSGVPFNDGTDVTLQFELDLGATVQAVVPQPVVRSQTISIPSVAALSDGDTLTIDDGSSSNLVFEFENTNIGDGAGANIAVDFDPTGDSVNDVATRLRDAINAATFSGAGVAASLSGDDVVLTGNAFSPTAQVSLTNGGAVSVTAGGISQVRDKVIVYFNPDELAPSVAEDPKFYKLINTSDSLRETDDTIALPQSVQYEADQHRAILTFDGDIPTGTFRLRVGASDESNGSTADAVNVGSVFNSSSYDKIAFVGDEDGSDDVDLYAVTMRAGGSAVVTIDPDANLDAVARVFDSAGAIIGGVVNSAGADGVEAFAFVAPTAGTYYIGVSSVGNESYDATVGTGNTGGTTSGSYRLNVNVSTAISSSDDNSSFSSATDLGILGDAGQDFFSQIQRQSIPLPQYPGGSDEPGHREIPAETHGAGAGTTFRTPNSLRTVTYHFPDQYGTNPQGLPLFNEITPNQKQRAREIFELYSTLYGFEVRETTGSGIPIITGDIRAFEPTFPVTVSLSTVLISGALNHGSSPYGGGWFEIALHEIGHAIGIIHSYDIPSVQGGSSVAEDEFPGNHDIVHGRRVNRPDATDIDLYRFDVSQPGTIQAEIVAERLSTSSLLDSALKLYRLEADGSHTLVAQNDDYFSEDAYIELPVDAAGTYFLGVSSTGNTDYDPVSPDTGFGGLSDGPYQLKLNLIGTAAASAMVDQTGTRFDGDADGAEGGTFEFHFRSDNTIFVDKAVTPPATPDGSAANPYSLISDALAAASSGDIIRILANGGADNNVSTAGDNRPYLIGLDDSFSALADGPRLDVPKNVVLQIDAGAVIKLQRANINAGSVSQGVDLSGGAIQVLGTPDQAAIFTAYGNDAIGGDSDGVSDGAIPGDWGGIVYRSDSDFVASDALTNVDDAPIILNYVNQADISFGGGLVSVNGAETAHTPVHIVEARPTVSYNTIHDSAQGAISADPDSFSDSRGRIGPDFVGNMLADNTINGLVVRFDSNSTGATAALLTETARFDDDDIVHVFTDNLAIAGNPGGPMNPANPGQVLPSGRLAIDPGIVVKLSSSRIEGNRGASNFIAEGTPEDPVIFTSLLDDRFGAGGTFDTTGNQSASVAAPGDWSGLVFNMVSRASIDNALIAYAGGESPIAGGLSEFNAVEAHHGAVLRVANSTLEFNADGNASDNRDARGTNRAATIFIRQAQPVIINNMFTNNEGSLIDINANAMLSVRQRDPGRSTGPLDVGVRDGRPTLRPGIDFADNAGPLVRLNRFADNDFNGMTVRGAQLSTESVWDDTDIVHILRDEIIVDHHHTFSGLRLASSVDESLVIKLQGANAGFTADGVPLDIDDRIGGTVQVLGRPEHPVVMTSLDDCTVGAGLTPDGFPQLFTNSACAVEETVSSDVIDIVLALDDTSSFTISGQTLVSVFPQIVANLQTSLPGADFAFSVVRFEEYAGSGIFGGGERPFILNQPVISTATPDFQLAIDAALARSSAPGGTGADETYVEALFQIATGAGFDGNNDGDVSDSGPAGLVTTQISPGAGGDVPDIASFMADPTGDPNGPVLPATGNIGGVGFRSNSTQRIVLLGTDGDLNVEDDGQTTYTGVGGVTVPASAFNIGGVGGGTFGSPGGNGATIQNTIDELVANNIKVIGLGGSIFNDVQSPLTALATLTGATDFLGAPLYFDIDPSNGTLVADAIVQAVTGVVPGLAANPGDWRGLVFNEDSNDRNVRVVLEDESPNSQSAGVNDNPGSAQILGELAKDLKSGDDNRALGFEVHGFINTDDPSDVDVYSFSVDAGTEVWIDIDRTRGASLDSVVELVRQDGTVLARSTGVNDAGDLSLLAQPMEKLAFDGGDFYTTNYQDPGMRVTLPGNVGGPNETYYVRVSSDGGLTNGEYQLQVRLRQADEKPGSTVRNADIRFATNAIEINGLPRHSPLLGENAEFGDNNGLAGGQQLGNQLETDRNTISVAGSIQNANDSDFYRFSSDYATTIYGGSIQSIGGVNGGPKTWSTVFDIDYADGLTRSDTGLVVYRVNPDNPGQAFPVLIGRESNVTDDQPGAGQGIDLDDLTRGSAGQLDPFIGPVQLPTGAPGSQTNYAVSVFSNTRLPTQLNQTYTAAANNPLIRLEPINSMTRIAEDHIGFQGYDSNGAQIDPRFTLVDISSAATVEVNAPALDLEDIPLYVSSANRLEIYDPVAGTRTTDLGPLSGATTFATRDIVVRSDGSLWGYQRVGRANNNDNGTAGRLVRLDAGNVTVVGNDNVLGSIATPTVNNPNNTNPSFDEITFTDDVEALAWERSGGTNNTAQYALYYSVSENGRVSSGGPLLSNSKLYRANPNTGSVARNQNSQFGVRGDIQPIGVTYASGSMTVSDGNGAATTIRVEARVPGAAGNGITVNVTRADQATRVTGVFGNAINLTVDDNPDGTAQNVVDAINSHAIARTMVTAAVVNGAPGENGSAGIGGTTLAGGNDGPLGPLQGNVTGLSFGQFHGDANVLSNGAPLFGVTDAGEFIRISTASGTVTNITDMTPFGVTGFQGLTLGPQNLLDGTLRNVVFAITNNGRLMAITTAGVPVPVFGGSILSPVMRSNPTGLAFSPLDFNVAHPTVLAQNEGGHGINPAFDLSRTPSGVEFSHFDPQGNEYELDQQRGGISYGFGVEAFTNGQHLRYDDTGTQANVDFNDFQRDLTSGSNLDTLPLGVGTLITHTFDLTSETGDTANVGDRPTLYFNYKLTTTRPDATARVSINRGGNSFPVATSESDELPDFVSHLRSADQGNVIQRVQPLFAVDEWRQARIDLSEFAGLTDFQLQFDASIGFAVDDIMIGWSERGELITAATTETGFFTVPQDPAPDAPMQSLVGPYQLEIRRGHEFGAILDPTMGDISISDTFDPNIRFVSGASLGGAAAADDFESGDFSSLGWRPDVTDAAWTVEDNSGLGAGRSFEAQSGPINTNERSDLSITVTTGAGSLEFDRLFTPDPGGNDRFQVFIDGGVITGAAHEVSGPIGDTAFTNISIPIEAGVHTIDFVYRKDPTGTDGVGSVLIDNVVFPGAGAGVIRGDRNLVREQGHIQIEGNFIRDSSEDAIHIEAAPRDPVTGAPHPGSPINFETLNTARQVPGVSVVNNVIARFGSDAISLSGEATGGPAAAVPLGKFAHNTIYGGEAANPTNGTVGIRVENFASPTMLNNLIVNTDRGVSVDASSSNTVLARTYFRGNTNDIDPASTITNGLPIPDDPTNQLFVNASQDNFYLAGDTDLNDGLFDGALAIDRSLAKLDDRTNFVAVKADLAIPASDVISPTLDLFGQIRVDDPQQPPSGVGSEIFSDVGAIERADFIGPFATLLNPLDNSPIDLDPTEHDVFVLGPDFLRQFIVGLDDIGIGIDDTSVSSGQWELLENGVRLMEGVDYQFIYNFGLNHVIFQSLTVFSPDNHYTINLLDRSAATGVRDLAGNPIRPNRTNGDLRFEISLDNGQNDPPVNTVPGPATTPEDTPLVFSTATLNPITVSDPDVALGTNELTLTLVAEHGGVVPRPVPGVTLSFGTVGIAAADQITVGDASAVLGQRVAVGGAFFTFVDSAVVTTPGPTDVPVAAGDNAAAVAGSLAAVLNHSKNFGAAAASVAGSTITLSGVTASDPSDPSIVLSGGEVVTPDGATVIGSHVGIGGTIFTYVDAAVVSSPAPEEIAVNAGDADTDVATATAAVLNALFGAGTATAAANVVTLVGVNPATNILTLQGDVRRLNFALNGLQFLPDSNYVGPASLTILTEDNGGFTFNGGPNLRDQDRIDIVVTPVNDEPTVDPIADQVIPEDTVLLTVPITGITAGPLLGVLVPNETEQVRVTAISSDTSLVPDPTVNYNFFDTTGSLGISPVADAFGTATITVTVEDAGLDNIFEDDLATPLVDESADNLVVVTTFDVTVTPVNDIPTLDVIADQTINEDEGPGNVILSGITAGPFGENERVRLKAVSDDTTIVLDPTITYVSPDTFALLTYDLVADAFGTATITVTVDDAGLDDDFSTTADNLTFTRSFDINVLPVNDLPTIDPIPDETLAEDGGPRSISLSGLSTGAANETEPLAITATSSDPTIIPDPTISYTNPSSTGTLTYDPVLDAFGGPVTITVRVEDGGVDGDLGTTADNGVVFETFDVTITEVNDLPEIDPIADQSIDEDAGRGTVSLTGINNGAPNEDDEVRISATSSDPSIVLDPVIAYSSPNTTGTLTYTLVPDAFGTVTITVLLEDAGVDNVLGTADDGTSMATFDIVVNPVNDPPTLNPIFDRFIDEDTGPGSVSLSGIDNGPANETEDVRITAVSSDLGIIDSVSINYTSLDSTGTLSYTLVQDVFGGPVTISVTVEDAGVDGIFDDDLATTGVDESADNLSVMRDFRVFVRPVNDPPTLDAIANVTVDEDSGPTTVNVTGVTAGPLETQPLRVTATSDNPTLVADPAITYVSGDTDGTLTFTPQDDQFGTAIITVVVEDGGNDGNLLTPLDNLTATQSFTVTVDPINDPPTLAPLADQNIDEDAPLQTIPLSGISAGPSESQNLIVTAVSDNPALIANPAVVYTSPDATGTLTYQPAADQSGTATITVTVQDGGDDNDLATTADNLTFDQSFVVTVNPVNDNPTITPLGDLTISEDAPQQNVALTGITSGGGESQPINITVSSDNTGLIPDPVLNYTSPDTTGSLSFTPVADQFGVATITVRLEDGGLDLDLATTADNGVTVETFVVTVQAVNDDPTLDAIADQNAPEDAGPQPLSLTGITAGAGESQPLQVTATSSDPTLVADPVINYISPRRDATLTYTSLPDRFGTVTVTVTVEDGGLDQDLSTTADNGTFSQSFELTIDPINDPPTIDAPADLNIDEESPQQTVNLSGITPGPFESGDVRVSASSDIPSLIPDPTVTYSSPNTTGSLALTPLANQFGVATITVTVEDAGPDGDFNTAADNLSFRQTFTVTVNNLPDPPLPMDDNVDTTEDTFLEIEASELLANDQDPDLGPTSPEVLSIVEVETTSARGATVTFDPVTGLITYDPSTSAQLQALAPGESLQDSFSYNVEDVDGEAVPPGATVFLNVTGINDAPIVSDDSAFVPHSRDPVVIRPLENDVDVDGQLDPDSIVITQEPTFGSLAKRVAPNGTLELAYSPFASFNGTDSFRYTISDNLGQPSDQATVNIVPNITPNAGDDVAGGVSTDTININVIANDVAIQGSLNLSTLTIVSGPSNGQATPQGDGTISYVPNTDFDGTDTFEYTITDTVGNVSAPTKVTVHVVESGLQNPLLFGDVNANGKVTSLDALLVINRLSRGGGQGSVPVHPDERGPGFFDVDGSMVITALDALLVINHIDEDDGQSAELVDTTVVASFDSDSQSDWQPVDSLLSSVDGAAGVEQKLTDRSAGDLVDASVIDLLAESQDEEDESAESASTLNDLVLTGLL